MSLNVTTIDQRFVLEEVDGKLYMVCRSTSYEAPIVFVRKWLVKDVAPESVVLGSSARYNGNGTYEIQTTLGYRRTRTIVVNSHADVAEELPFECPKVRKGVETRYMYGGWQKLTRGEWQPA